MIYFQSQVDRLLAEKDRQTAILQEQVKRLESALELETKRANNAIDQLLVDNGKYPITPGPEKERNTVEDLVRGAMTELAGVGEEFTSRED